MSLVPESYLPPLVPALEAVQKARPAHARMLRLATWALVEATAACTEPPPLLLAVPEARRGLSDPIGADFLHDLQTQAETPVDEAHSKLYRQGGAGGLLAIRDALALLAAGQFPCVLVGAVDTFLDLPLLLALERDQRLAGASPDGFIPGEASAFLLLASRGAARQLRMDPIARVTAAAAGVERGHRGSSRPLLGDGLSETFQSLFAQVGQGPKVPCVYAGMNGESLPGKEWGVAYLRSSTRFNPDCEIEHPADCVGDAGAALGLAMLGMAAIGIENGHHASPVLVWSTSDQADRAAVLVEAAR
jgi:3-oxoacyl-[acyl-carrier-protein] synthase-1